MTKLEKDPNSAALLSLFETYFRSPECIEDLNHVATVARQTTAEELHLNTENIPQVIFDIAAPHKALDAEGRIGYLVDGKQHSYTSDDLFGTTTSLLDVRTIHVSPLYIIDVFRIKSGKVSTGFYEEILADNIKQQQLLTILAIDFLSNNFWLDTSIPQDIVPVLRKNIQNKTAQRLVENHS
jgi:hypothetical protein